MPRKINPQSPARLHLGLDLGTNSVGWALTLLNDEGQLLELVRMGSRIIHYGGSHKSDFNRGKDTTVNANRRTKRGARRNHQRYLLRRDNFLRVLSPLEVNAELVQQPSTLTPAEYYGLRKRALTERVALVDLMRILYRMMKRRGYRSNRKDRSPSKPKEVVRFRETSIVKREERDTAKRGSEHYVTLADGTTGEVSKKFDHPTGVLGVFKIVEKEDRRGERHRKITLLDNDDSAWQGKLDAMEYQLEQSGTTPGAYFADRLATDPHYRVRERFVLRKRYIEEFDAIWVEQERHHPALNDQRAYDRILTAVLPKHSPHRDYWRKRNLRQFVRDYIIFYQRPLKSKRSAIGNCPLESKEIQYVDKTTGEVRTTIAGRKVIPKSHPLYQEFRIWDTLNNLRLDSGGSEVRELSGEQKAILYDQLLTQEKISLARALKLLQQRTGLPRGVNLRGVDRDIPGHATRARLMKAARQAGTTLQKMAPTSDDEKRLWHLLLSVDNSQAVERSLRDHFGLKNMEQFAPFLDINWTVERGSYSAKAIGRLLPLMRAGSYFDPDALDKVARERINVHLAPPSPADPPTEVDKQLTASRRSFTSVTDFQGLPLYLARTVQYGDYRDRKTVDKYERAEQIKPVLRHSVRNPIVERVLNEMLAITKDLWQTYGRPDRIRVELARELRSSKEERSRHQTRLKKRTKERESLVTRLASEFNIPTPSRKDILRYELWELQRHRCPYTGRTIPKSALYSGETDIDHIIPRSRYWDDSFTNKVLTFQDVNSNEKGNQLPYEWLGGDKKSERWDRFLTNIEDMNLSRRHLANLTATEVPDDFTNRQLQDTRYISRAAVELLAPIAGDDHGVGVSSGKVTAYLREEWGLNEAFKRVLLPRYEHTREVYNTIIEEKQSNGKSSDHDLIQELTNRSLISYRKASDGHERLHLWQYSKRMDHRHHALDALVVALTTQGMIQRMANLNKHHLSNSSQANANLRQSSRYFPLPHPKLTTLTLDHLQRILVSHKSNNRLVTNNTNYYKRRNPTTGKLEKVKQQGRVTTVRGQLHEETNYGLRNYHDPFAPLEKPISKLSEEEVELIMDHTIRDIVAERVGNSENLRAFRSSLKKRPIVGPDGDPVKKVILYRPRYVVNRPVASLSKDQLKQVMDKGVRTTIGKIAGMKGPDPASWNEIDTKNDLTPTRIAEHNESTEGPPLHKARSGKEGNMYPLYRDAGPEHPKNLHVDLKNNFGYIIYEPLDGGEREFEVITFMDAVKLKLSEGSLNLERPGYRVFLLRKGDTVYVPPAPIDSGGKQDTPSALRSFYRVVKFDRLSKSIYFAPISVATTLDLEYGSATYTNWNASPYTYDAALRSIKDYCYPVFIDRLGERRDPLP